MKQNKEFNAAIHNRTKVYCAEHIGQPIEKEKIVNYVLGGALDIGGHAWDLVYRDFQGWLAEIPYLLEDYFRWKNEPLLLSDPIATYKYWDENWGEFIIFASSKDKYPNAYEKQVHGYIFPSFQKYAVEMTNLYVLRVRSGLENKRDGSKIMNRLNPVTEYMRRLPIRRVDSAVKCLTPAKEEY